MRSPHLRRVILSFIVILAITGSAKVVTFFGRQRILNLEDPIFEIPFRVLLLLAGGLELLAATYCCVAKARSSCLVVAWLASCFLIYRSGLMLIGWKQPCPCLGNLTGALHIPPRIADNGMKVILGYLVIISYSSLFWFWKRNRKNGASAQPESGNAVTMVRSTFL